MLVYRLTVQRQKYFYSGEDIQNETRLHVGEERLQLFLFGFVWFSSWWTCLVLYQRMDVF